MNPPVSSLVVVTVAQLRTALYANTTATNGFGYNYISYDLNSLTTTAVTAIKFFDNSTSGFLQPFSGAGTLTGASGVIRLNVTAVTGGALIAETEKVVINFTTTSSFVTAGDDFYVDILSFGDGNSTSDRKNNAVYRMLLKESGDNTGTFTGTVEYCFAINVELI